MSAVRISVAVITLNEVDRIDGLLDSVGFADEVVVVDSGSSDGTVQRCRAAGARVIHHPWSGYADQKQFAMGQARGQWVLNLDADEAVPGPLAGEIQNAVDRAAPEVAGYRMPRLSRYLGRWIRHGGWYPDRKVRLVRPERARWQGQGLHERLEVTGRVETLRHPLHHYVYRNISDQIGTIDRFSAVHADLAGAAGAPHLWLGLPHAAGKFVECYLWKLGCLDGLAGLVIAMNSSWYVFLKHAKRWERSLRPDPGNPDGYPGDPDGYPGDPDGYPGDPDGSLP